MRVSLLLQPELLQHFFLFLSKQGDRVKIDRVVSPELGVLQHLNLYFAN
jgi:hypothetical protein